MFVLEIKCAALGALKINGNEECVLLKVCAESMQVVQVVNECMARLLNLFLIYQILVFPKLYHTQYPHSRTVEERAEMERCKWMHIQRDMDGMNRWGWIWID